MGRFGTPSITFDLQRVGELPRTACERRYDGKIGPGVEVGQRDGGAQARSTVVIAAQATALLVEQR